MSPANWRSFHRRRRMLSGAATRRLSSGGICVAQSVPKAQHPSTAAPPADKVQRVILSASPFAGRDDLQATQPSAIVGREALTRDRAANLGDTLATQPGVQSTAFGPVPRGRLFAASMAPHQDRENGVGSLDVASIQPRPRGVVRGALARGKSRSCGPGNLALRLWRHRWSGECRDRPHPAGRIAMAPACWGLARLHRRARPRRRRAVA